jgi:hypothetical protein
MTGFSASNTYKVYNCLIEKENYFNFILGTKKKK